MELSWCRCYRTWLSLLILTVVSFRHVDTATEGEEMYLEATGNLLPNEKISKMITDQLISIREVYPEMGEIKHRPKWAAGELIITGINQNNIGIINGSRYGPLTSAVKMDGPVKNAYRLVFSKPYHPARLSEEIMKAFDLDQVEANLHPGDGNDVQYIASSPAPTYYTYIFKMGWGECHMPGGCIYRHFWEFSVAQSAETFTVRFEKDYGSDVSKKLRLKVRNRS